MKWDHDENSAYFGLILVLCQRLLHSFLIGVYSEEECVFYPFNNSEIIYRLHAILISKVALSQWRKPIEGFRRTTVIFQTRIKKIFQS